MKQCDDDKKKQPPVEKTTDGQLVHFRKPKPGQLLDVEWFYEDEEFFAEWMDEFDW